MTVAVPLEHPVKDRLLTPAQRAFWEENGYVIIPDAVPQENREAVIEAIWEFLQVDRDDPETWYQAPVSRAGMLEMFHHQSLWDNRQHPKIYQAFADVWQQEELWVSIDRANMNPPARSPDWDYNGMFHWDIDTTMRPLPRMVQGVLYLTDTTADQGGFQCAPGFHRQFHEWVKTQPADRNPRRPDPDGLDIRTIPGQAGDFLIWDSMLPHGNSRNHGTRPRLAQYITMFPPRDEEERRYRIRAWQERLPPRGDAYPGDPRELEQKFGKPGQLTGLGKQLLGLEPWA